MAEFNPNNHKYSAYFSDNQTPSEEVTLDEMKNKGLLTDEDITIIDVNISQRVVVVREGR